MVSIRCLLDSQPPKNDLRVIVVMAILMATVMGCGNSSHQRAVEDALGVPLPPKTQNVKVAQELKPDSKITTLWATFSANEASASKLSERLGLHPVSSEEPFYFPDIPPKIKSWFSPPPLAVVLVEGKAWYITGADLTPALIVVAWWNDTVYIHKYGRLGK